MPADPAAGRAWTAVLCGLAAVAAALYAFPLSHLGSPVSFDYSEGWNSYWDAAAGAGRPLYAASPDLTTVNYPPLSFHLVGLFARVAGDVTLAGRILGVFGLAWSALNVATAATAVTGSRRGGVFAALCLLLWIALLTPGRLGSNDPHFLALALSTLGVCAYLRGEGRAGWTALAAVFFVAALFVKNNLLAFPLATGLHLLATCRFRALASFVAAGALLAASLLALTVAVDGGFAFAHLFGTRSLSRANAVDWLTVFATYFYAPVLIGTAGLVWARGRWSGYVALCLACAAVLAALFGFGNGVAGNAYYETLAALAVACSIAVHAVATRLRGTRRPGLVTAATALAVVSAVLVGLPATLRDDVDAATRLPQREADYAAGIELLRATPGPALCESLLMCFEAGKPFVLDPYYVRDQVRTGRIDEARIVADLVARRFAAVQIGENQPNPPLTAEARVRFGAPTMQALLANYRVVLDAGAFVILLPR